MSDLGQRAHHGTGLAALLGARAAVNVAFAAWVVLEVPGWHDVFHFGAIYALVDGGLGMLAAVVAASAPRGVLPRDVAFISCADAVLRIGAGIAILALPGLPDVPMVLLPFFAVVCVAVTGLGIATLALTRMGRAGRRQSPVGAVTELLSVRFIALASLVAAVVLAIDPPASAPALRLLVATAAGMLACAFALGALGAERLARSHARPLRA